MTDTLRKGRADGWNAFKMIIFPILQDIMRDVWVTIELITVLIGLVLSIATVTLDQNEVFNILHLALAI